VWSGNSKFANDEYRSIPFEFFATLLKIEKFNFFKLSKDLEIKDVLKFYSNNINNLGDKTFYELSYYLKRLDMVISCDSSIVHLCGILGVKCILLLNFNSDWRWFDNKYTTEWYPSITIIKQKKFNDWEYVFEKLKSHIEEIYKRKFNNN
jgi:ADP-heptose:LPS heptosyltransferase